SSYMGHDPRNITVEQFKSAIGQGKPVFACLTRIREDRTRGTGQWWRSHTILIDAVEEIDGEECIVYRNPAFGQGAAVSWKDFLEVFDGRACIPIEVV